MLLSAEIKEIGPVLSKTTYKSSFSCQMLNFEFILTVPSSSKVFLVNIWESLSVIRLKGYQPKFQCILK